MTKPNSEQQAVSIVPADKIMEQAQVFASCWSLVGGRFDNGEMSDTANEEKAELERMVRAALASVEAPTEPSEAMIAAYLDANTAYWRETDAMPAINPSKWRNGTVKEATRVSLRAALAFKPEPAQQAVPKDTK